MLKGAVLQFAEKRDPKFAEWLDKNGAFPNTMVDRIAPSFEQDTVD